jgi:hypothetical protein
MSRAAQLAARQGRSRAKTLRAQLRAARLTGRKAITQSRELRSRLTLERLIHRVTRNVTPSSTPA